MPEPFVFDCTWDFPVPRRELWAQLRRTDRYTAWWPWLARCEVSGLHEGAVARCLVRPPLPYRLRFTVTLDTVVAPTRVVGTVAGDLGGEARLDLTGDGDLTRVRLAWELTLANPMLRALASVARPAMLWGHDRVVTSGLRQFASQALGTEVPAPADAPA